MQHNLTFLSVFQFTDGGCCCQKFGGKKCLSNNQIYKATFSNARLSLTREKLINDRLKCRLGMDIIIITHQERNFKLPATRIWKFFRLRWSSCLSITPKILLPSFGKRRDSSFFKWRKRLLPREKRLRSCSRFRVFSALAFKRIVKALRDL